MSLIETSGRSKRYSLLHGGEPVASGVLSSGDFMATSLEVIAEEDDNAFLFALDPTDYPPLPSAGTWLEINDIYSYEGSAVMVRQSHARTEHAPADVPALFVVWREDAPGLEWIVGEPVSVGAIRVYEGTDYRCRQAHTTQADWTPDVVQALWEVYDPAPPTGAWAVGVAYVIGDIVTYEGSTYECRQSHTSQAGWTPPVVPALWLLVP